MSDSASLTTDNFLDDDPTAIYIAVMGPTGTGKTTLINLISGSQLRVGNDLESCTDSVQISQPFYIDGQKIFLVDTPGFDDTRLSDTKVVNMIAAYMSIAHERGRRLAGIIYTHRILDNRMGGISARNFRVFRNLCGDRTLRNVIIATTMWDDVDERIAIAREAELASKDVFFKPAIDKGARMVRHSNTLDSATRIISLLLTVPCSPSITLQVQEELQSGLDMSETQVGKEISRELFEQVSRHRQEMHGLMEDIHQAIRVRDEESRQELMEERRRMEGIISRLQHDSLNMSNAYRETLRRLEDRLNVAEAEAMAAAAAASASSRGGGSTGSGNKNLPGDYQGQQTHSPIVQAVAATENSNAVLEGKLAAAVPVVGFWGKMAVMLAPFSLTWR